MEIVKLRRYCLDSSRERTGHLLGAFGLNLIYFDLVTFSTILINFACPARVRECVCECAALLFIYLLNFVQLYEEVGLASDEVEGEERKRLSEKADAFFALAFCKGIFNYLSCANKSGVGVCVTV